MCAEIEEHVDVMINRISKIVAREYVNETEINELKKIFESVVTAMKKKLNPRPFGDCEEAIQNKATRMFVKYNIVAVIDVPLVLEEEDEEDEGKIGEVSFDEFIIDPSCQADQAEPDHYRCTLCSKKLSEYEVIEHSKNHLNEEAYIKFVEGGFELDMLDG